MNHEEQAKRLREIDDLLIRYEGWEYVRVSYAQLRALRDELVSTQNELEEKTLLAKQWIQHGVEQSLLATHAPVGRTPDGAVTPMLKRLVRLGLDNGMTAEVRALSEMWDELHRLRDAATPAPVAKNVPDDAVRALIDAAQMAVEMIETNKHERRHVRWALKDAMLAAAQAQEGKP